MQLTGAVLQSMPGRPGPRSQYPRGRPDIPRGDPVGMGGDVAEQTPCMGGESRLALRGRERAISEALRLVEPAEH
jgi:hypothetical protein